MERYMDRALGSTEYHVLGVASQAGNVGLKGIEAAHSYYSNRQVRDGLI